MRNVESPVRFIASNGIGDDINTLVLIEELTITEQAGGKGTNMFPSYSRSTGNLAKSLL